MDFDNILNIASQNQGFSSVQKRYSLQAGPSKKDPKSKGVNPAAVQALLKKQCLDSKKKELQMKKRKEELIAKRVELKSDRKARAMASRTKDNFKGYNGIPMVEGPKKRRSKLDMQDDTPHDMQDFWNNSLDPEDDEDNYEYEQTDSESEQEPLRPGKTACISGSSSSSNKHSSKITTGPPKPAPPTLNFSDLLKLAEKKQFEPVELKTKVARKEERLRTADEIRELEMERKAKRQDKDRNSKGERERDGKSQFSSNSIKKNTSEKEQKNWKTQKNSFDKHSLPSGSGKKLHAAVASDRDQHSSNSSLSDRDRDKPKTSHSDRDRSKTSLSGSSKATSSQVSAKVGPKPSSSYKSNASSDLSFKKESSLLQGRALGISGTRPPGTAVTGKKSQHGSSQQTKPVQGSSLKQGVAGHMSGKVESVRQGISSAVKSSGNSMIRSSSGGTTKAGNQPQAKSGGTLQAKPRGVPLARPGSSCPLGSAGRGGSRPTGVGPGRTCSGGPAPGRSSGGTGSGPGRPQCTVVSETISSKNVGGLRPGVPPRPGMPQRPGMPPRPGMPQRPGMPPRPGMPQRPGMPPRPGMPTRPGMPPRPGMPQRPGMPPRPMMNRPPVPMLPPITSAYKRKYEDEEDEDDPEMDDFIDDEGEEQEEISRHIKEIFGYDRNKYKDESDYALKFMESSWRDVQKEEARSLRMAVQEDLEEEKREQEELKIINAKRKRKN